MNISFKSTYRIPLSGPHMSDSKRETLKKIVSQYQNVIIPDNKSGNVRISIRKKLDERLEQELSKSGIKVYQKFDRHNIRKSNYIDGIPEIDSYIKEQLNTGNYKQVGKQKNNK